MNSIIHEDTDTALTDLKDVIRRQKETIKTLEGVIDQIPGCVYWKDKHGNYLGQNQFSADNLYGHDIFKSRDKNQIIGKTDFDIYTTEVAKQFRIQDADVVENNRLMYKEELLELEDGARFIQLSTKQPYRDADGHVIGVIGNTVDISYLKKIESRLREEKEIVAQKSEEIKDDFMRNMEHDIRTPLNGIIGISEHLIRTEGDDDRKELLSDIRQCARELMNYCNSILEFARIEKGVSPAISKKFSLRELVERIIQIERPAANNKKLDLIFEWSEDLPDVVIGDDYRLYRILVNLVSNAIKFTNQGYVKLMINAVSRADKHVVVQFIIKDTGIGIPKDKQSFIYEKFTRLDVAEHSADRRGIGLGLRVVKQFVEELGGEVELESYPNSGSTFICAIPFDLPLVNSIGV